VTFMIDSQVLIYALAHAHGEAPDERYSEMAWRSFQLVNEADGFAMSAISWFEFLRVRRDEQQTTLFNKWQGRIEILPVDARVAARAAALIEAARSDGTLCPKCLGLKPPVTCTVCGSQRSKQQRTHDTFIVAGAAVEPKIKALYSFDGGVLELGEFVDTEVTVREPTPAAVQLALGGAIPIREGNVPRQTRSKKHGRKGA
jgi:predicted nucleic acid-binding protein